MLSFIFGSFSADIIPPPYLEHYSELIGAFLPSIHITLLSCVKSHFELLLHSFKHIKLKLGYLEKNRSIFWVQIWD